MFAVVALRSTTVLATMESVSGDTAVDHGGDVAHIRGRKLTQETGPYTYDLTTSTKFALVDISSTISSGDFKFGGAATASNGKIIFAPYNADGVGVFDPSDNSFVLVDIASTISTDWKFHGAATAGNGKVIFAPSNADGVGVFDPSDNSFVLVDIASTISSTGKFRAAATAGNGKVIFAPLMRTAWECSTRATTASCWWTSHRPSLLT